MILSGKSITGQTGIMTNEVLQEIQEELKWEKIWGFLLHWRYVLLGALVALLAGTALGVWYTQRAEMRRTAWSTVCLEVVRQMDENDDAQALKALKGLNPDDAGPEARAMMALLEARILDRLATDLPGQGTKQETAGPALNMTPEECKARRDALRSEVTREAPEGFWAQTALLAAFYDHLDTLPPEEQAARIQSLCRPGAPFRAQGFESAMVGAWVRRDPTQTQQMALRLENDTQTGEVLQWQARLVTTALAAWAPSPSVSGVSKNTP
jgi:hypothetical protein